MPPGAMHEARAPHERPPLPPGTRVDGAWIWLLVVMPWVLASTIFLFDAGAVLDALWVGDTADAIAHVALHLGVLLGSSLAAIGLAMLFAWRDARMLRARGVVRPFPWGFAAIAGLVYVIGRHLVLRRVNVTSRAPLLASITLYVLWYAGFALWAVLAVANALAQLTASAPG